ncbi:nucleotide pyrophosphohydrolase [Pandoraea nosoerga]|nr:nucleotide pyrophosphohydrolase [Pandoraea nosoerga]
MTANMTVNAPSSEAAAAGQPAGSTALTGLIDTSGLEAALHAFADARDWHRHHTPKNLAMALSVEVAELVEIFQWHTEAEAKAVMQTSEARHVEQELADIAMYLVRLASVLGVDLNRAVHEKLVMNAEKYPVPPA